MLRVTECRLSALHDFFSGKDPHRIRAYRERFAFVHLSFKMYLRRILSTFRAGCVWSASQHCVFGTLFV